MMNVDEKMNSLTHLVVKSVGSLDDFLTDILKSKGGREILDKTFEVYDVHNFKGFCGHNFWLDNVLVGQIHMATLRTNGFVIYRKLFSENNIDRYDYFDELGNFLYSASTLDFEVVNYQSINMDNNSPFINHLYNMLNLEYADVINGSSRTVLISYLEGLLNKLFNDPTFPLSAKEIEKDFALQNIVNEIHRIELDPVYRWNERQQIYKNLKLIRKKIIQTKSRVHKFNRLFYSLSIFAQDLITRMKLIKKRPLDNIKGFLYQNTIGNLLWFAQTVKSNLGYSIALAIYGPFTFYFITQPMNPHAMWAVGKVRSAYIKAINSFDGTNESGKANKVEEDVVSTTLASNLSNTKVDWQTRMGDFKAMQIALEANMVFAERMGRIEQMESQFSFPLTAESAWNEIERYINQINADLAFYKNLDPNYQIFLKNELQRAKLHQEYIWKKMAQFFLDHPFISVDEDNKQTQRDYYVGRAFIFMDEMTKKLNKDNPEDRSQTHAKVFELAQKFRNNRVNTNNILANLDRNSKLFSQENIFSSEEFRSYMKRHWEILFIQQNKKQEASSFGLQAYTWSIKNAIWTLQSLYSVKKEDLKNLSFKFNLDNKDTDQIQADSYLNNQFENLFHLLNIEYVSLKKEFSHNLKDDSEALLREGLINSIKSFFTQRDQLFNQYKVASLTNKGTPSE